MPARSKPRTSLPKYPYPYCGHKLVSPAGLKSHIRQSSSYQTELKKRTQPTGLSHSVHEGDTYPNSLGEDHTDTHLNISMEYPQDEDLPEVEEPPSKRARVEEVVDKDLEAGGLPKQPFHAYENAEAVRQATKGIGETLFERIQLEQSAGGYSS